MVIEMFEGRTLPTALETVRLTFLLEGLDLTNVTHIIRHRNFSFSAQSTDPVSMEDHDILTNDAFDHFPELQVKAKRLMSELNQLYKTAVKNGISYYDARHYMPRAKESKYFMSGNIKDWMMFLKVRLGEQNQPTSDRILALRIRQAILEAYPIQHLIPVRNIEWHYINAMPHKMNLNNFPPNKLHQDVLKEKGVDWTQYEFGHDKPRDEYPWIENFKQLESRIINNEI